MEKLLSELVEKLRKTYGERLTSVILYGSAAVGDRHENYSDINVLCVLREVGLREMREAEPLVRWWRSLDNPAPLLLSENEVRTSTDCFPIEFHDICEQHRILHGEDVVAALQVDDSFYRAQVEYQLRAKLLRLRQKGAGAMFDREMLLRLLADSVSTFCVLARHALRLRRLPAPWQKREIVDQAAAAFGMEQEVFHKLLDLREGKVKPRELHPEALFEAYLKQIQVLVEAADRLDK